MKYPELILKRLAETKELLMKERTIKKVIKAGVGAGEGGRGKIEPCLKANDRPGEKAEMYKKCQHYLTKVFTTLNFFLN